MMNIRFRERLASQDEKLDAAKAVPAEPNVLLGLLVLVCLQLAGEALVLVLQLSIPGAIVGLLLLLAFMARGTPNPSVEAAARLLLKFLPMFLVPVCVGIMEIVAKSGNILPRFLVTLAVAVPAGVALTAWITRRLIARRNGDAA